MTLLEEVRASHRMPSPAAARLIRVTAGVSQERLAAELGVHRMTVHRWEAGERKPRGHIRARYAALLQALQQEMTAA